MEYQTFRVSGWYRFLQVTYFFFLFIIVLLSALFTFIMKPRHELLINESGFTCPNKQTYTWSQLDETYGYYSYPGQSSLYMPDHFNVLYFCNLIKLGFNKSFWDLIPVSIFASDEKYKEYFTNYVYQTYLTTIQSPKTWTEMKKDLDNEQAKILLNQRIRDIQYVTSTKNNPPYKISWVSTEISLSEYLRYFLEVIIFFSILQIILG